MKHEQRKHAGEITGVELERPSGDKSAAGVSIVEQAQDRHRTNALLGETALAQHLSVHEQAAPGVDGDRDVVRQDQIKGRVKSIRGVAEIQHHCAAATMQREVGANPRTVEIVARTAEGQRVNDEATKIVRVIQLRCTRRKSKGDRRGFTGGRGIIGRPVRRQTPVAGDAHARPSV